jgi:hypothetical protein
MKYIIFFCLLTIISSCSKAVVEPIDTTWLIGKIKSIEYADNKGEKYSFSFEYEIDKHDSVITVKTKSFENVGSKTTELIRYKRDDKHKITVAERKFQKGDSTVQNIRKYFYDASDRMILYYDSLQNQLEVYQISYYPNGQINRSIKARSKNDVFDPYDVYYFEWNTNNTFTKINIGGAYQATDYTFLKNSNPINVLYTKYIREIPLDVDEVSPLLISEFQSFFPSFVYKYTYTFNADNQPTERVLLKKENNNFVPISRTTITYY